MKRTSSDAFEERKFKCSHCPTEFPRFEQLKRHNRKHTGEKPYSCPFEGCGKSFSRSDNMRQHYFRHLKDPILTTCQQKKMHNTNPMTETKAKTDSPSLLCSSSSSSSLVSPSSSSSNLFLHTVTLKIPREEEQEQENEKEEEKEKEKEKEATTKAKVKQMELKINSIEVFPVPFSLPALTDIRDNINTNTYDRFIIDRFNPHYKGFLSK